MRHKCAWRPTQEDDTAAKSLSHNRHDRGTQRNHQDQSRLFLNQSHQLPDCPCRLAPERRRLCSPPAPEPVVVSELESPEPHAPNIKAEARILAQRRQATFMRPYEQFMYQAGKVANALLSKNSAARFTGSDTKEAQVRTSTSWHRCS